MARDTLARPATHRSRRLVVIAGALSLVTLSAFLTWWMTTLSGLPDVGDPFDVAAFAESPVPDDQNAYVCYRQAVSRSSVEPGAISYDWATAGPVEKNWLETNRGPLELWRQGTERPKALYVPSQSMTLKTQLVVVNDIRKFPRLAQLEAGRLEAEGDLEGAWRWYRAIFRSSRHVGRHATAIERLVGRGLHNLACNKLNIWMKDPRVTPAMLHKALDAAIADYESTGPVSDNFKVEYLMMLKSFADPELVRECLSDSNTWGTGHADWFARNASVFSMAKTFKTEPERSRRVIQLVLANILSACDLPPERRPPVGCTLMGTSNGKAIPIGELYTLDASASTQARALPPDQIRRWYESTLYARNLTFAWINVIKAVDAERTAQANLVIALANRLFEVERGQAPRTVEELVGPYLKSLPEGYRPIR